MKKIIYNKYILCVCTSIIVLIIIYGAYYYMCFSPSVEIYDSKIAGPTILIVSGTHGNERAPVIAINKFFKEHRPKTGKVIVIDDVNYCGLVMNDRFIPSFLTDANINRQYTKHHANKINKLVMYYASHADYVFDFHEASDFQYLNFNKLGNSLSTDMNIYDSEKITNILNKKYNDVQWTVYLHSSEKLISGTLFDYCVKKKISYILIESSTENNMNKRINQATTVLDYIYNRYLM